MHTARLSDSVLVVTGDYAEEHLTVIATGDGLVVVDTLATLPATRAASAGQAHRGLERALSRQTPPGARGSASA